MIQFARHHTKWHIIGEGLIALIAMYVAFLRINDARSHKITKIVAPMESGRFKPSIPEAWQAETK